MVLVAVVGGEGIAPRSAADLVTSRSVERREAPVSPPPAGDDVASAETRDRVAARPAVKEVADPRLIDDGVAPGSAVDPVAAAPAEDVDIASRAEVNLVVSGASPNVVVVIRDLP